jgi:putative ABC transport system permease protein
MIRSLDRKLLRECWHLRGQMLSIALVVACGIMTVVTMRGTYDTLARSLERYYRDYRFADVFASLERAPNSLAARLAELPGVAFVETRVALGATLDVPGLAEPAVGRLISLPPPGRPALNDIHLVRGRLPDSTVPDEILVSESFANANGLALGTSIGAVINGRWRTLRIVGVAISPDFIGELAPGTVFPDDRRFAVIRMNAPALAAVAGLEGAFNDVSLRLAPGANEAAVIRLLDRLLEPYGGLGAYGRDRHISDQTVQSELSQNRVTGTLIPGIFLGVAAFLLSVVLGRLIGTQREEIAVLKAFGYGNVEIGRHYLRFALLPVLAGAVLGVGLGIWFGQGLTTLYGEFFRFPELNFRAGVPLILVAVGVSVVAAVVGAVGSVGRAVRLEPAIAMRPETPARFRPGLFDRALSARRLTASARFILRAIERRPLRTLTSGLGIALSTSLVVSTLAILDSVRAMIEVQFDSVQREDLAVTFTASRPAAIRHDLARMDGVTRVELTRTVPVRIRHLHRERTTALVGLPERAALRRIVDRRGSVLPVPVEGVVLSSMLARALDVGVGDSLAVNVLEGRRPVLRLPVAATVDDMFGSSLYIDYRDLHRRLREPPLATDAFLIVNGDRVDVVNDQLKRLRAIAAVTSPAAIRDSFEQQLSENLWISMSFLLVLAGILTVGLIYNGARIALSERARELASLRVLGFTRREVAVLLLGEQAAITALAIPVGWLIGLGFMAYVLSRMGSEQYRIPLVVSGETFFVATLVTAVAAAAAAFAVRRRLDHLDLIEVLKTRE